MSTLLVIITNRTPVQEVWLFSKLDNTGALLLKDYLLKGRYLLQNMCHEKYCVKSGKYFILWILIVIREVRNVCVEKGQFQKKIYENFKYF